MPLTSVPVPSTSDPSLNVTVPVGMPAPGVTTATVAFKVIGWPKTAVANEEVTVVLVVAALTFCVSTAEVLAAKALLPL